MAAKEIKTQFQVLPSNSVDLDAGIIRGVSVMTIGPALGHGIDIDKEGLESCLAACLKRGSVRLIDRHDGEFEDIVGAVTNFRIEGNQVKGDAELFDNHPMRARILEIAQKIPTEFGLSIECDNQHIELGDKILFRCSDVDAVALVPRPATNIGGLFSKAVVDTSTNQNPKDMDKEKFSSALKTAFTKLSEGEDINKVVGAFADAMKFESDSAKFEERLRKLEEAAEPKEPTEEEKAQLEEEEKEKEKKDEEKMSKLAEKIADERVTKLASAMGVSRAPSAGGGFVVADERTKFESEISTQLSAGAKDRATAIFNLAKAKPDVYNAAREKGLI